MAYFGQLIYAIPGCAEGTDMAHCFYGWERADVPALTNEYPGVHTPVELYDALTHVWCAETCAPRMRGAWCADNPTLGQCSITAFLVQDIFGGEVYGVPLKDGGFHCFNCVNGRCFDLTSEQFGDARLRYGTDHPQLREVHFAKREKRIRYEYLRASLKAHLKCAQAPEA